jgi:hypothetical protein
LNGAADTAVASAALGGYLCGTHSKRPAASPEHAAALHRRLRREEAGGEGLTLGVERWEGCPELTDRLSDDLADESIVDLVVWGSQARGDTTGFSDVDGLLVITDAAAESPGELRRLRRRVLAAQRAVLAYQPMQHHGFAVATPLLLRRLDEAIRLPRVSLEETRSLRSAGIPAWCTGYRDAQLFASLLRTLRSLPHWPAHRWELHRCISMFELVPASYLQACGLEVSKAASFAVARGELGRRFSPYDELCEVRRVWPRVRDPVLETAARAIRNPWSAVAVWRRLAAPAAPSVRELLTTELWRDLHGLLEAMDERLR